MNLKQKSHYIHLHLLPVFTQRDPALIARAHFPLDGEMSEWCRCGAPGSQSSSGISGAAHSERSTQQCGRRRAQTRGIVRFSPTSRRIGVFSVVRNNLPGITPTKPHRKGHQLAWKQLRGAYFPDKTLTAHLYSQPQTCGIAKK